MSGPPVYFCFIPGEPVPASRPRVTRWGTYNSKRYKRYKETATLFMQSANRSNVPIGHAIAISVEVVIPRPQKKPRTGLHGLYWKSDEDYPAPIGGKWGDLDNYIKSILDAAQEAKVIVNDSQVVEISATKHAGDEPGVHVTICIVDPDD